MKTLLNHIKNRTFARVYLLTGSEDYLRNQYKNRLRDAMIDPSDTMNYSHFEGKNIDPAEVISLAETLPFFSERRVILIENSGWFKSGGDFADALDTFPAETHLIFVETEVDKRNRLYKAVKDRGVVSEMTTQDEDTLIRWIAGRLQKNGLRISRQSAVYFLEQTGTDMERIQNELEKLICYAMGRQSVTPKDIDAICVPQVSGRIFDMVDAIAAGDADRALALYHDLLMLRESPMSILYLITRQFNLMLQAKELSREGQTQKEISSMMGVAPFVLRKSLAAAGKFSLNQLKNRLLLCMITEEQIKTGRTSDRLGTELLLVELSGSTVR
ncbi:MAG: DNA polymerase III subunit delta [Lachnospiraceae bacterium]|nr:DNA polymerase III subunit delta [Lachnospiraceae bacterium]